MVIKCVAIDDEPLALELIQQYVSKFPVLKMVQVFDDAINGAEFIKQNTPDLLFIDINMPDITGIELVRSLRVKPMIIFTTAYRKFAMEGFEEDAIDYLLKPIPFERFSRAVNKAIDYYKYKNSSVQEKEQKESFFVNADYQKVRIDINNIEYIESIDDYVKIHLGQERPVLTLMTLKAILLKLPADRFLRIHRSYVVSLQKIKSVANRKVMLSNIELPVSNSYADDVNEWMKSRL